MILRTYFTSVLTYGLFLWDPAGAAVIGKFETNNIRVNQTEADHHLQRRSDCSPQTGTWNIACLCNHANCTEDSFRRGFTTVCTSGQPCYLSDEDNAYWSSTYQGNATFLIAVCSPHSSCGDGMGDYTCTCFSGFVDSSCGQLNSGGDNLNSRGSQCEPCSGNENSECDLRVILPATIVPAVGLLLISATSVLAYKWYHQRKGQKVSAARTNTEH